MLNVNLGAGSGTHAPRVPGLLEVDYLADQAHRVEIDLPQELADELLLHLTGQALWGLDLQSTDPPPARCSPSPQKVPGLPARTDFSRPSEEAVLLRSSATMR